MKQYKEGSINK